MNASNGKAPSRGGVMRLVQILCLLIAAFVVAEDVGYCAWDAGLVPQAGALGATFNLAAAGEGRGFVRVESVEPGGALSGLAAAGDRIAFDRPYDYERNLTAGEAVGFTLVHAGEASHHRVVVPPHGPVRLRGPLTSRAGVDLAFTVTALFGAFIIWRGGRRATPLLLGMALVAEGLDWVVPSFWASSPDVYPFVFAFGQLTVCAIPVLFYAFALRFYEDWAGPTKPWEKAAFWVYAAVQATLVVLNGVSRAGAIVWPVLGDTNTAEYKIGSNVGLAACVVYLFLGWRRSSAGAQQRYALLLLAASAVAAGQFLGNFVQFGNADVVAPLFGDAVLAGVVAPILFTYAILRNKVFDLGFALNRTLVYGVVSAILLAGFGLIEWAVDHFVPIQGREKNAVVDALIAVGVFLTFHRVRDWVEHAIESLFFRRWQQAEAALRRFVKEAPFFTEAPALTKAFVRTLSDYAEGAPSAVYLAQGSGFALALNDGLDVPTSLDADLRVLVSLRADPKPLELNYAELNAALIAPMVNRNEVIGLAVLGAKPSGHAFRPDEIDLIGWATHQAGLDLHALKVERLEAANADLTKTVAVLEKSLSMKPA